MQSLNLLDNWTVIEDNKIAVFCFEAGEEV